MKSSPVPNRPSNTASPVKSTEVLISMEQEENTGTIFNIQKFSVHDGPGIRTTVFMKGCPLRCKWCSNAESMNPEPEPGVIYDRCNNCGRCIEVCPEVAIGLSDGEVRFDREKCTACGVCIEICPEDALTVYGKQVSIEDVFKEVNKDRAFFEGSSGGVTASGGEPLRQADFVAGLFQKCRQEGIATCLDTCGYAPAEQLEKVLAFTDDVLFDIKLMDSELHKEFTGMPNDIILHNAQLVAESKAAMLCRIPLVKDVNSTEENIRKTAEFINTLGDNIGVELLPYHRLGIGKYKTLDRIYPGEDLQTPDDEEIEAVKKIFENYGITCLTGE